MTKTTAPVRFAEGDPARVGYARVSTADQSLDSQLDALRDAGCGIVYTDHGVSGTTTTRPGLDAALAHLRAGDVFTVVRLDRLGRTTKHLIATVEQFEADGVQFASLTEGIDTTTPAGRMMFTVLCAVAQMERDLIAERTRAGLDAARARGRKGGRKPALTPRQVEQVRRMRHEQDATLEEIADTFNVSRSTIIRVLNAPAPTNA
ncbi:recombinase family protein [Dietzia sp. PP-33]|jgi:DNA invertase Pin-like site-specific DNA recombinase|uniref:recombinase family protein n=1 Tax=Dietzia sp. PP-33 TaxID=2957500 RepID=UPI0029A87EDF|nr:recombinase family protein [Dietzia sp. PP-33]MDX2358565.1 recombinase family protein [Dietzia sp. PP-33]